MEEFTFVVLRHSGHTVEKMYMTRAEADTRFTVLSAENYNTTEGVYVAYYCASVGGLVNGSHCVRPDKRSRA